MSKFDHNDFPEDPSWGIERQYLDVPNDASYRKNYGQTNFARAFDQAKKQGLPDDLCLAVAACITEGANGIKEGYHYLMTGLEVSVLPISGMPKGVNADPVIELKVRFGNVDKQYTMDDILRYHIPTMSGHELRRDQTASLPETLWYMSTHPKKDGGEIQLSRMHVSAGGFLGEYKPTRVVGLGIEPMDDQRRSLTLLAAFPIDRLELTANERTLLNEAGDDGFELVMAQRIAGNKVDGKQREQLITEVRAHRKAKTEAVERQQAEDRAAEQGRSVAEAALRPKPAAQPEGILSRIGRAFRGGNR